jgi:hypothetical protein
VVAENAEASYDSNNDFYGGMNFLDLRKAKADHPESEVTEESI